jgi:hypothetical protein
MDPALVTAQQRELRDLILQCLGRFDAAGREPDLWESIHLMNAIKAFDAGAYALCRQDLQRALRPAWSRSGARSHLGKPHSLADLRAAFEQSLRA